MSRTQPRPRVVSPTHTSAIDKNRPILQRESCSPMLLTDVAGRLMMTAVLNTFSDDC